SLIVDSAALSSACSWVQAMPAMASASRVLLMVFFMLISLPGGAAAVADFADLFFAFPYRQPGLQVGQDQLEVVLHQFTAVIDAVITLDQLAGQAHVGRCQFLLHQSAAVDPAGLAQLGEGRVHLILGTAQADGGGNNDLAAAQQLD